MDFRDDFHDDFRDDFFFNWIGPPVSGAEKISYINCSSLRLGTLRWGLTRPVIGIDPGFAAASEEGMNIEEQPANVRVRRRSASVRAQQGWEKEAAKVVKLGPFKKGELCWLLPWPCTDSLPPLSLSPSQYAMHELWAPVQNGTLHGGTDARSLGTMYISAFHTIYIYSSNLFSNDVGIICPLKMSPKFLTSSSSC